MSDKKQIEIKKDLYERLESIKAEIINKKIQNKEKPTASFDEAIRSLLNQDQEAEV